MSLLPDPVPLSQPPGDPQAALDLVADLAAAAGRLADLATEVGGATARVPGWRGADADAAATRAAAVAGVASRTGEGLRTAAARLAEHAERWLEVRRRVQTLRAEQDADFALARIRVATPFDPAGWDSSATVLDDLAAAERGRHRAHAALLDDLADDAAATGRVLAGATAGIDGGTGSASVPQVLGHLAAELPAWATAELARRGWAFAERFLEGSHRPEDVEALAGAAAAYTALPGFAAGFFARAGRERGTVRLFEQIGTGRVPADGAFTGLLAAALSALDRGGDGPGALPDLLAPGGPAGDSDLAVAGVAAVLALAARRRMAGPPPAVLLGWGRDLLARERATGLRPGVAVRPAGMDPRTADPFALVARALVDQRGAGEAVGLLGGDGAWWVVLNRAWDDRGALLGDLVSLAGTVEGAAAGVVLRGALEQIGTGLVDGDPDGWTVDRAVVKEVAPALSTALVAHLSQLTDLLMVGVDGHASGVQARALHGLGYVSVVPAAAATIEGGLRDWRDAQQGGLDPRGSEAAVPAIAVPAAFFALREFGQRMEFLVSAFTQQALAERREAIWNGSVGLAAQFAGRRVPFLGELLGMGEAALARALGWDGRFEPGLDRGLRFDAGSAVAEVLAALEPADDELAEAVSREAARSFLRTAEVVHAVDPPKSSDETWTETILGGLGPSSLVDRSPGRGRVAAGP